MDKLILSRTFKKLAASSLSAALMIAALGSGHYAAAGGSAPTTVRSVPPNVMSFTVDGAMRATDLVNHAENNRSLLGLSGENMPLFRQMVDQVARIHEGPLTLTSIDEEVFLIPHRAGAPQLRIGEKEGQATTYIGVRDLNGKNYQILGVSQQIAARLHKALGQGDVGGAHSILDQAFDLRRKRSPDSLVLVYPGSGTGGLSSVESGFIPGIKGWVDKYQTTQGEFQQRMKFNLAEFKSGDAARGRPVENVSWFDAAAYANQRSVDEGFKPVYEMTEIVKRSDGSIKAAKVVEKETGGYRLLTDTEWEYAAGTVAELSELGDHAVFYENLGGSIQPVGGTKKPNARGLRMYGNVWEWTGSLGDSRGWGRVLRGGAWYHIAANRRSASRSIVGPGRRRSGLGFRLVRPDGGP